MLCRALLTAVAVSYLLCVLWLSGIQKEDLDVNMLTKLHRHNVSIENMNNETLRQACSYKGKIDNLNITQNAGDATIKTSRSIDNRHHNGHQNISDNKVSHHTQLLPSYLNNNEKKSDVEKKFIQTNQQIESRTPIILQRTTYQNDKNDYPLNPSRRNIAQETTAMSQSKDKPDIQNIMKFWQTIASNMPKYPSIKNVSPVPMTDITQGHSTSRTEVNIRTTQSMEDMIRLVAEYISKSGTTTTEPPITRDDDLKALYSNLIANMHKKNAPIMLTDEFNKNNVRLNLLNNNITPDTKNVIYQSPVFVPDKVITENLNPQNSGSLEHVLKLHNQYKIYAPIYLYHNNFTRVPYKIVSYKKTNKTEPSIRRYMQSFSETHQNSEDENSMSENLNVNRITQDPSPEINISDNLKINGINQESSPIISKDVLREIANTVRDYVLRDLKKELATKIPYIATTPTSIFSATKTTTTATTSHTTPKTTTTTMAFFNTSKTPSLSLSELTQIPNLSNMTGETRQVLDGFLKLFFDQVKAVHKTTIITHDANYKMTNTHHEYFNVTNDNADPVETPVKSRRSEVQKEDFVYPTNVMRHSMLMRPALFDFTPQEREQLKNVDQVPIIQTNSNEIAPIGVPLNKPLKLVHHVEVVTTDYRDDTRDHRPEVPLRTKVANNYHNAPYYDNRYNRYEYPDYANPSLNNRDRYYKRPGYDYKQNYREVETAVNPQRRDAGFDNNYKEMYANRYPPKVVDVNVNPKLSNSFNELFNRKSAGKPKQVTFDDGRMKQQKNRVKFHEKLEKVTDSLSASEEKQIIDKQQFKQQFKVQVASRQQMPLNGMKKGYGDEHFKNFLKTQQKVNDMLERILSTKSKPENDLPLIETA